MRRILVLSLVMLIIVSFLRERFVFYHMSTGVLTKTYVICAGLIPALNGLLSPVKTTKSSHQKAKYLFPTKIVNIYPLFHPKWLSKHTL